MVDELQGRLDVWQGILQSLGGDLDCGDPNKNYWYGIGYDWN